MDDVTRATVSLFVNPIALSPLYAFFAVRIHRDHGLRAFLAVTVVAAFILALAPPLVPPPSDFPDMRSLRIPIGTLGLFAAAAVIEWRGTSSVHGSQLRDVLWALAAFLLAVFVPLLLLWSLAGLNPD